MTYRFRDDCHDWENIIENKNKKTKQDKTKQKRYTFFCALRDLQVDKLWQIYVDVVYCFVISPRFIIFIILFKVNVAQGPTDNINMTRQVWRTIWMTDYFVCIKNFLRFFKLFVCFFVLFCFVCLFVFLLLCFVFVFCYVLFFVCLFFVCLYFFNFFLYTLQQVMELWLVYLGSADY